jgi:hypothetical protein
MHVDVCRNVLMNVYILIAVENESRSMTGSSLFHVWISCASSSASILHPYYAGILCLKCCPVTAPMLLEKSANPLRQDLIHGRWIAGCALADWRQLMNHCVGRVPCTGSSISICDPGRMANHAERLFHLRLVASQCLPGALGLLVSLMCLLCVAMFCGALLCSILAPLYSIPDQACWHGAFADDHRSLWFSCLEHFCNVQLPTFLRSFQVCLFHALPSLRSTRNTTNTFRVCP